MESDITLMREAVAYCRVSTDKEDQLNSLEAQRDYFIEHAKKNNFKLIEIYADEGITGTKTRERKQFLRMLEDAERGRFQVLFVKDISRFARNTLDSIGSLRKLKACDIKIYFINNEGILENGSEFMFTLMSAVAQEESENMSKRVKFGKRQNAQKGKVPNLVYGYDKIPNDFFNLNINAEESRVVNRIFSLYVYEGYGCLAIAQMLNSEGYRTKKGCEWSQIAISRLLKNEIYIGKIVNGKEETKEIYSYKRAKKDKSNWIVVDKPELQIIEEELFYAAQKILQNRKDNFHQSARKQSNKHLFSTLIRCKCCGRSFRRRKRKYKNTYIDWVCSKRYDEGKAYCDNAIALDEGEMLAHIKEYLLQWYKGKEKICKSVKAEIQRLYERDIQNDSYKRSLITDLENCKNRFQKSIELYKANIISMDELTTDKQECDAKILTIEKELMKFQDNFLDEKRLDKLLSDIFDNVEDIINSDSVTNEMLKRFIDRIEVDEQGNVDVIIKSAESLGINYNIPFCNTRT